MTTLAHAGGIPETLSVLVPLALVIVLLRVGAKKTPPDDLGDGEDQQDT